MLTCVKIGTLRSRRRCLATIRSSSEMWELIGLTCSDDLNFLESARNPLPCAKQANWLATRTAGVNQAAEYHFRKNIRGYVTTAPFGVEVFSRRCGHCFLYCL